MGNYQNVPIDVEVALINVVDIDVWVSIGKKNKIDPLSDIESS